MFSLLWSAFIGLLIGAVAKLIVPGKDPGGIWITMLLDIAGSFLASWTGRLAGLVYTGPVCQIHCVCPRCDLAVVRLSPGQTPDVVGCR
jgi:uncharacterized membrane protein YeaQ/YmgE (transglycosylase-associated protein family)